MNFAKFYLGDYLRDTGSLTLIQHGAYTQMLFHFYATERPLPTGRDLYRLLRAETRAEREAIDWVVGRFWTLDDGGLVNKRAVAEMAKRTHQRDVNREIGSRGGRPKNKPAETDSVSEQGTDSETDSVIGSVPVTKPIREPNRNPNHSQSNTVAKATGAEAPPTPAPDPIFGDGLAYLMGCGIAERGARSFLGKLRKEVGDLAATELLAKAQTAELSDPMAWLRTAAEKRVRASASTGGLAL